MKKLLLILLTTTCFSQEYISLSFDVNNLLNLKDNTRMEQQVNGLDFDIEIGAIDKNIGVYVFYGAFPNAKYYNYGAGVDYYIKPLKWLNLSLGNYYSVTKRTKDYKYLGGGSSYFNPRARIIFVHDYFNVGLVGKYQTRLDLDKRIFEGSLELVINL